MRKPTRRFWLWCGPLVAMLVLLVCDLQPGRPAVTRMAAVSLWMAIWWIAEPVPLAVTALLPLAVFPVLSLVSHKDLAPVYLDWVTFLFIGGCLVAMAMEKWGLNRRLALRMLLIFGGSPVRMLLGFMLTTAFISMWMSNTAAALVMLTPAMAVIEQVEARDGVERTRPLATALLLAVAYAASIGGVGTLVGTPTNLVFIRQMHIFFPKAPEVTFFQWMRIGLPLTLVMSLLAWGVLWFLYLRGRGLEPLGRAELKAEYAALGPAGFEQKLILGLATAMVFAWVFRADIDLGGGWVLHGWTSVHLFGKALFAKDAIGDATVAMLGGLALLLWPSRGRPGEAILTWAEAERLPWGIVLLFGGGFALAKGFQTSGLDKWCGANLGHLGHYSPLVLALCICLALVFITEFTANTSTVEMVLPVLAAVAIAIRVNPLFLLVPATICASFGFMLPAGTPPNAMVFATQRMSVAQMARTGFLLNLSGAVLATLAVLTWGRWAFGVDLLALPSWVQ